MSFRSWFAKLFRADSQKDAAVQMNREELLRAKLDAESARAELDAVRQSWPPTPPV
jgi:hypothetical protein